MATGFKQCLRCGKPVRMYFPDMIALCEEHFNSFWDKMMEDLQWPD